MAFQRREWSSILLDGEVYMEDWVVFPPKKIQTALSGEGKGQPHCWLNLVLLLNLGNEGLFFRQVASKISVSACRPREIPL